MFSKRGKQALAQRSAPATGARQVPFSLIGSDVSIVGNIEASVDLHIDGRVDGDIACAALVQGPDSRIKGHITARTARVAGVIEGSIAADELIVEASARIIGDVTYGSISIAPGGQVAGLFAHRNGAQGADLKLVSSEG
ncbi:MAG TPA: polymer-forming cytoskeletal protein [Sphingobium sp.]|nr:polymer-forming cytoskeletal protein [Sphingobium sp.]